MKKTINSVATAHVVLGVLFICKSDMSVVYAVFAVVCFIAAAVWGDYAEQIGIRDQQDLSMYEGTGND